MARSQGLEVRPILPSLHYPAPLSVHTGKNTKRISKEQTKLSMTVDLARPILTYIRAYYIEAPQDIQRYFMFFGELDHELLSVRTEQHVMALRLREVQRLVESGVIINDRKLHDALVIARKHSRRRYARLARLRQRITAAKEFQYSPDTEEQSFYLLADIIGAIMGMDDPGLRQREQETFLMACEAYGRQNIRELTDIHESIQDFLSLPRRDYLEEEELAIWNGKLRELYKNYPLQHVERFSSKESIAERIAQTKRRIAREQTVLERTAMAYIAALRTNRNRN